MSDRSGVILFDVETETTHFFRFQMDNGSLFQNAHAQLTFEELLNEGYIERHYPDALDALIENGFIKKKDGSC